MNEDEIENRTYGDLKKLINCWTKDKIPEELIIKMGLDMFIGLMFISSHSKQDSRKKLQHYLYGYYAIKKKITKLRKKNNTQKENT